jgi:hypothetical protein
MNEVVAAMIRTMMNMKVAVNRQKMYSTGTTILLNLFLKSFLLFFLKLPVRPKVMMTVPTP